MELILIISIVGGVIFFWRSRQKRKIKLAHLPKQFVVFDLETTGLDPEKHEIIEFGASIYSAHLACLNPDAAWVADPGKLRPRLGRYRWIAFARLRGRNG